MAQGEGQSESLLRSWPVAAHKKKFDEVDDDEEPVFERAVRLPGRSGPEKMFGFVPAVALSGLCRLDPVQKVNAIERLMFLAKLRRPG